MVLLNCFFYFLKDFLQVTPAAYLQIWYPLLSEEMWREKELVVIMFIYP